MFFGSIVALITPFSQDNQIDFARLTQLIEWHIDAGTQAVVLAGTTGESPTLSHDEVVAMAKRGVEVAAGRIAIIVGNGSNNTAAAVTLTRRLNDVAIDGLLTVTPYYNKPTNAGLLAHFQAIAAVSQHPIILYNVPSRTQCDLSNDLIVKLSELNNIVGIKDATGDLSRLDDLLARCPQNFSLLSGDDVSAFAFVQRGGHGVISVTANIVPEQMAKIQQALAQRQYEQAAQIEKNIAPLHTGLFIESNPIAVKWSLNRLGRLPDAGLRLPLVELSIQGQAKTQELLEQLQLYPQES